MTGAFKNDRFSDLVDKFAPLLAAIVGVLLGALIVLATGLKSGG